MTIRFLIPWRSDDGGRRDQLAEFTSRWWATNCPEIEISLGTSPDGPFNRAAALNNAAEQAGEWDIGIILDADVIAPPAQIWDAATIAALTGRICFGFRRFVGLGPGATARILDGSRTKLDERGARFITDYHESSIVAVPRALWKEVGGFDERFVGWGQEDVAFVHTTRLIAGPPERVDGRVHHLFHPRSAERDPKNPRWIAAQELGNRYRTITDEAGMRAMLVERRV